MKKKTQIFVFALIGLLCAGSVWAHDRDHGRGRGPGGWGNFPPAETVAINGNLQLVEGHIAVVADGKTYFVNGFHHLIGFIDGLKEGAAVRLEGSATPVPLNSSARFLRATKLTINGKTYDLPAKKNMPVKQ
ncbi:hypothetical protein AGMMS4952_11830 [Spirochaetia bacterium]|nr:hypothetical protein AGMMS4952_11830 [Spirochaetia bacterium]